MQTPTNFDFIPHGVWRFGPVLYGIFAAFGLGAAGIIGWGIHREHLLQNGCNSPEVIPSISATIGDFVQERVLWRSTFPFLMIFQMAILIGMTRIYAARSSSSSSSSSSSVVRANSGMSFNLNLLKITLGTQSWDLPTAHFFFILIKSASAFGWTMIASFESLLVHEASFGFFAVFGILQHIVAWILAKRYQQQYFMNSPGLSLRGKVVGASTTSNDDPLTSLSSPPSTGNIPTHVAIVNALSRASSLKIGGVILQLVMILSLAKFFIFDHLTYCLPYAYSKACACEWIFSYLDIMLDFSYYYDMLAADYLENDSADTPLVIAINNNNNNNLQQTSAPIATRPEGFFAHVAPYFWIPTFVQRNGVPRALLWIADIFFGYLLMATGLSAFQAVYFVPMVAMTFTGEAVLVIGPAVVALLLTLTPFLKLFITPSPATPDAAEMSFKPTIGVWVAYVVASASFLHVLIEESAGDKILVACMGPGAIALAFRIRALLHSMRQAGLNKLPASAALSPIRDELQDEATRLVYAGPLGLVFSLLIRYYFISIDPFYTHPHVGPIASVICVVVFIPVLMMQERYLAIRIAVARWKSASFSSAESNSNHTNNNNNNSSSSSLLIRHATSGARTSLFGNPAVIGVSFGAMFVLAMQYCTSANVIQRLVAVDPLQTNATPTLIFVFCLGVFLSPFYSQPSGMNRILSILPAALSTRRFIQIASFIVGPIILFFGATQSNKMTPAAPDQLEKWQMNELSGSPYFAFCGGLLLVFGIAACLPATAAAFWNIPISLGSHHDHNLHDQIIPLATVASSIGKAEAACFGTSVTFVFVSIYIVCFPFVPGGMYFRDRYDYFLFPACFLIFFTQRALFDPSDVASSACSSASCSDDDVPSSISDAIKEEKNSTPAAASASLSSLSTSSPSSSTAVLPAGLEVRRLRIALRILLVAVAFAGVWRMIQQPGTAARDPFGHSSWIYEIEKTNVFPQPVSTARFLELNAQAYEKKHGVKRFLESDALHMKATAHLTSAIWTLHFGLDNDGADSLHRIVDHVRTARVSILGLLESDGQRFQTANRDIVEFIAYHADLPYTDFGPTTTDSTFGCALLSRFPIISVKRIVAPSPLGELACLIDAIIELPMNDERKQRKDGAPTRMRVLVGHNGNTDHVQDLVLQTDLIGKLAADSAAVKMPIIFLGYVTSQPSLVGHNYYRMIQSDGEANDRMLQRSSPRLFGHGFNFTTTGEGIPRPKIPYPTQRNRFRDTTKDILLWKGPIASFKSQQGEDVEFWTDPKEHGRGAPRTFWEAHVLPGTEFAFLNWTESVLAHAAACSKIVDSDEWKRETAKLANIRAELALAAQELWDEMVWKGLGDANPMSEKEAKEFYSEANLEKNVCTDAIMLQRTQGGGSPAKIYRLFLDAHWELDAGAKHRFVKTLYYAIMDEAPKIRDAHPRFPFEDRYCQQIYYRDVMPLDWFRDPIGKISDTELQVFTFGV